MSIITETAAGGGTQFAYDSEFRNTGSRWSKVQINTVAFYTSGAITSWTLQLKDTAGAVMATILSSTTTATFYTTEVGHLPVTDDGESYQLAFTTVGMAAAGTLTIDWQIAKTGAT
jgi:hypothetical protein